jgi:serine/threonine-protein kinase HipA
MASEDDTNREKPEGDAAEQVEALLKAGTSMGGARPKATVEHDRALWLAKFKERDDRWNNPRVEHAMMTLARKCGIHAADTKVITIAGHDVLLVKRFDRQQTEDGYLRSRMVSAMTILKADERDRSNWSYLLLADELRKTSANKGDLTELFKRVVFNALISNTDDHARNHALIASGGKWGLSPVYDLTPYPQTSVSKRNLAMSCGEFGTYANKANLLSKCGRFFLSTEDANTIIDQMTEVVRSQWHLTARACGVSEDDCKRIENAFVYEGFHYDAQQMDSYQSMSRMSW